MMTGGAKAGMRLRGHTGGAILAVPLRSQLPQLAIGFSNDLVLSISCLTVLRIIFWTPGQGVA